MKQKIFEIFIGVFLLIGILVLWIIGIPVTIWNWITGKKKEKEPDNSHTSIDCDPNDFNPIDKVNRKM